MFLVRYRGRGQVRRGVPPKLTNPVILFCTLVDFDFWPRLHQVLDAQQGLSATAAYTRRSARMRAATTAIPTFTTPSTTSRWTPAYLRLAKMKSGQPWLILSLLSSTCDWSSYCCYIIRLIKPGQPWVGKRVRGNPEENGEEEYRKEFQLTSPGTLYRKSFPR